MCRQREKPGDQLAGYLKVPADKCGALDRGDCSGGCETSVESGYITKVEPDGQGIKEVKDNSKISGLSNWKNGVTHGSGERKTGGLRTEP